MGALTTSKASFIEPEMITSLKCGDGLALLAQQTPSVPRAERQLLGRGAAVEPWEVWQGLWTLTAPHSCWDHLPATAQPHVPALGPSGVLHQRVGRVVWWGLSCVCCLWSWERSVIPSTWGVATATSRNRQLVPQFGKWFSRICQSWRSASGHVISRVTQRDM